VLATTNHQPQPFLRSQITASGLIRVALDPLIILVTLFATTVAYEVAFEGPYIILSVIVFSMTFPASPPQATSSGALAREVIVNWAVIASMLLVFGWATRSLGVFSPQVLATWASVVPLVAFAAHRTLPALLPKLLALESIRKTAIVIGAGDAGCKLARQMRESPFLGMSFSGYFDDRVPSRLSLQHDEKILGKMSVIANYVKAHHIDLIFIALPMATQPRILKLLDELRDTTASVYFTPDIFLFDLIQARIDNINGIPIVAVCETPFYGVNGFIKRLSDVVIASTILALIAPLLLAIAIGVKLGSRGPVLFKQRRYGLDGKEIIIYKFRSMTVCEDGDNIRQATKNDGRVTRFGAFLRRTSLDELPQFFNVLQGRMSVVGPRPHAVAHNEMYRKLIKGYMIRHKVRPGVSGWAQVNGLRGETDTVEKMRARIEYDLAYLRNWSLRLDLAIILRTVLVVLKSRNAY
jgi:putative colanic acid biosysnthesis UDP-glucose lipid carrier transferase